MLSGASRKGPWCTTMVVVVVFLGGGLAFFLLFDVTNGYCSLLPNKCCYMRIFETVTVYVEWRRCRTWKCCRLLVVGWSTTSAGQIHGELGPFLSHSPLSLWLICSWWWQLHWLAEFATYFCSSYFWEISIQLLSKLFIQICLLG